MSLLLGDYIWQDIKQSRKLQRADQTELWKMHLLASGQLVLKTKSLEMRGGSHMCADHSLQTDSIVCLKMVCQQFLAGGNSFTLRSVPHHFLSAGSGVGVQSLRFSCSPEICRP